MNAANNARRGFEKIFDLVNSGQFEQAENSCRSFLVQEPDDINVLGLLGAVLLKLGKSDEAQQILAKTIQLQPEFAKPHEDLGMLCLHQGDAQRAVQYFEEAIRLDGNLPGAYAGLAQAFASLGKLDAAKAAQDRHVEISPIAQGLSKARQLLDAGQSAQAQEVCDALAQQYPANTGILRVQANIAIADGRSNMAEGLLKRVIGLSPLDPRSYSDFAKFLGNNNRFEEGVDILRKAIEIDPALVVERQLLGDFLSILGQSAAALEVYDATLQIDPDNVPALTGRGHMLKSQNKLDDAIAAYKAAIAIRPDFGDAWWSLASLRSYRFDANQFESLRGLVNADDKDVRRQVSIQFAMARALEKDAEFDDAWHHYGAGNALQRSRVQYDPVKTEVMHDRLVRFFDAGRFSLEAPEASDGPVPVFIVGMPRSGSTLIEQILASHSDVEGGAELPYIEMLAHSIGGPEAGKSAYPDSLAKLSVRQLDSIGRNYLYHAAKHCPQGLKYFTDKMPSNFMHVGFIRLILPHAKIIDVRRHPVAACIANYRHLFARGKNHSYELFECAEYYLEYTRIMSHWDDVLPGRVLRVNYEDVVRDLESQTRRLLDFCNLPWDEACLNFHQTDREINTASSEQVRLPIYEDAVDFWKNFEPHLDELKQILEPAVEN